MTARYPKPSHRPTGPGSALTGRQLAILTLAASGLSAGQIAVRLGIQTSTVRERLHRIYVKLGARDRTHAVVIALKRELIDLDDIDIAAAPAADPKETA